MRLGLFLLLLLLLSSLSRRACPVPLLHPYQIIPPPRLSSFPPYQVAINFHSHVFSDVCARQVCFSCSCSCCRRCRVVPVLSRSYTRTRSVSPAPAPAVVAVASCLSCPALTPVPDYPASSLSLRPRLHKKNLQPPACSEPPTTTTPTLRQPWRSS
jgi:hypothetical protein